MALADPEDMGFGASIVLIALGAILNYAVTFRITGLDLHVVGLILMVAGAAGLIVSLLFWAGEGARRRRIGGPLP